MEVTREVLEAFTQATIKSATELERIVTTLEAIVVKQDKIVDRVFNGMVHEIVDGVTSNYNQVHKETLTALEDLRKVSEGNREILLNKIPVVVSETVGNSSIAKDISFTKWFISIVGLIVLVASVILRGLDNRLFIGKESTANATIQHLLETHISQTKTGG